jgi:hypothetical protein
LRRLWSASPAAWSCAGGTRRPWRGTARYTAGIMVVIVMVMMMVMVMVVMVACTPSSSRHPSVVCRAYSGFWCDAKRFFPLTRTHLHAHTHITTHPHTHRRSRVHRSSGGQGKPPPLPPPARSANVTSSIERTSARALLAPYALRQRPATRPRKLVL